ncbi:hypothetical protein K504DRAFT_455003 [Pleomassaria siparia CBS 279.74]|uniref:Uncharacterized protein n=1 Tax=Pleomassaria siparia CBS 279.74 TaxID=1314801 RepID=A0A6G1K8V2_9PLEO|nr:hypothetical protein K504DRAFT_455003 [Pleomassaria siparia CBS 279.74]
MDLRARLFCRVSCTVSRASRGQAPSRVLGLEAALEDILMMCWKRHDGMKLDMNALQLSSFISFEEMNTLEESFYKHETVRFSASSHDDPDWDEDEDKYVDEGKYAVKDDCPDSDDGSGPNEMALKERYKDESGSNKAQNTCGISLSTHSFPSTFTRLCHEVLSVLVLQRAPVTISSPPFSQCIPRFSRGGLWNMVLPKNNPRQGRKDEHTSRKQAGDQRAPINSTGGVDRHAFRAEV